MLSRVAERTYWIGRYLERAENLARLCNVFGKLFLDLPTSTGLGWLEIVQIVGALEAFEAQNHARRQGQGQSDGGSADPGDDSPELKGLGHGQSQLQGQGPGLMADEGPAIRFLLIDAENPDSLLSSLAMARENARTTRDILPTEAWLAINRLYLETRDRSASIMARTGRHEALRDIVADCQTFAGLVAGTMSHGDAYRFVQAGINIERADMTSRTLDAAVALLLSNRDELGPFDNTLWMAVLKSVSGYQMYRQSVRRRVTAKDVIGYLFTDEEFPRSVRFCVTAVGATVSRLPRHGTILEKVNSISANLAQQPYASMTRKELHQFIDIVQLAIGDLHVAIAENWFQPDWSE